MTKSTFFIVSLFVISSIAVLGVNSTCQKEKEKCSEHSDCCTNFCNPRYFVKFLGSYCTERPQQLSGNVTKNIKTCEYDKDNSASVNESLPYSGLARKAKVTYNGKSVTVPVFDQFPNNNKTTVDLSEDAAKLLGVVGQRTFECELEYIPQNNPYLRSLWFVVPFLLISLYLYFV